MKFSTLKNQKISRGFNFDDELGDFLIANSSAMTHIYPIHAHRGSETESEGSDLAPVSDVKMDVDENDQYFTHTPKTS